MAFGISKNFMPRVQGQFLSRPALGLPGMKASSMPGLQRTATMPKLMASPGKATGTPDAYDSALRNALMVGLKKSK